MEIKISEGGKLSNLTEPLDMISVNVENNINLWITDKIGNESLTYPTIDEALKLRDSLNDAIRKYCKL